MANSVSIPQKGAGLVSDTAYSWPTTVQVGQGSTPSKIGWSWLFHSYDGNGTQWNMPSLPSSFSISAASGKGDDWSFALMYNNVLWTTGTNNGNNGPNDNTPLAVSICGMDGSNPYVQFQWGSGSNFQMSLYFWALDII